MSIFISTGEISGDIYAAKLAKALKKRGCQDILWGMGGSLAEGVSRFWSNEALHIMGFGKIASSLPKLLRLREQLAQSVLAKKPRAVVVVDSPDFHIPLIMRIRSLGYSGPVVYVSPPTIWAWRGGRVKHLKKYCDICLPLFDFEVQILRRAGVPSYWGGHPLVEDFCGAANQAPSSLPEDPLRVALLPGSRGSEIRSLLSLLERCGREFIKMGLHPVLSIAPGLAPEYRQMIQNNGASIAVSTLQGRELMAASRFVVGASGTAAVEAMLLDRYMVVLYRGTWLEWNIFQLLRRTPFVSIPNVLAQQEIYPELLQEQANLRQVLKKSHQYLSDKAYRRWVHDRLAEDRRRMGAPGVADRWAAAICSLMDRRS